MLLGSFIIFKNFSLFHVRNNVGNFSEIFSGKSLESPFTALNSSLFVNVIEKGFPSGVETANFKFSLIHFSQSSKFLTSCSFVKMIHDSDNFLTVG